MQPVWEDRLIRSDKYESLAKGECADDRALDDIRAAITDSLGIGHYRNNLLSPGKHDRNLGTIELFRSIPESTRAPNESVTAMPESKFEPNFFTPTFQQLYIPKDRGMFDAYEKQSSTWHKTHKVTLVEENFSAE